MATAAPRQVLPLEQALDLAVELLGEIETAAPSREYYGRVCAAVCDLVRMERAGIWLYDSGRHDVSLVGAHGVDVERLAAIDATVESTPVARRALEEDRVLEVRERIEEEVPAAVARELGLGALSCTPLSVGGTWYGVMLADRGGASFALTDTERHLLYTSGKVIALAASTRIALRQQERARRLADRLNLAREIHERVLQRLFGVSLVLASEQPLDAEARGRCAAEIGAAVGDLRSTLQRPLAPAPRAAARTLRQEVERLPDHRPALPVTVSWAPGAEVPAEAEPLAQSVLAEALRNVRKHARPSRVEVEIATRGPAWSLEVRNDGVAAAPGRGAGDGMGLRLAALEALQHGGVVEFGPPCEGWWRLRLVLPGGAGEAAAA